MAFALEWRCLRCETLFASPLVSVVLIDPLETRRNALVLCLKREGVPVFAATRLADLVSWPVGKILVTDITTLPRFETGAEHVVVLVGSDDERTEANEITGGRATVVNGDPATLLTSLRGIAAANAIAPSPSDWGDRRIGPRDRRRHTRRDRRS